MKKQNIFLFYSIFVMLTVYALMGIRLVIVTADSNGVDHFWSGSHFHTNRTSSYNIKKVAHDIFDIHADPAEQRERNGMGRGGLGERRVEWE